MAVTEPDRSQSPRCPCKAPPKFYHPMVRLHRRGTAPDSFVALAVDWFKMSSGESRRWRAPQLTNGLTPADQRRWRRVFRKLVAALFVTARLRPVLPNYRRTRTVNWLSR